MPKSNQRQRTWDLIRRLHMESCLPWFLGSDFNEILSNSQKTGGCLRVPRHMGILNSTPTECGLADMGYDSFPWTWSNGRVHPNTVRCRLDRVCANTKTFTLFTSAHVVHIDQPGSDHIPVLLSFECVS